MRNLQPVRGGAIEILALTNGTWTVSVNGARARSYASFDEAITAAGDVTFNRGESPGSWNVRIVER